MSLRGWLAALRPGAAQIQAWQAQAQQQYRSGNFPQAEAAYRKVVRAAPENAEAWNDLACVLLAQGRSVEAEQALQTALRLDPSAARVHHNLAGLHQGREGLDLAIHHYARAVELDPRAVESRVHLGAALRRAGRHEEALAAYADAVRLAPEWAQLRNDLGTVYKDLGRFDDALVEYRAALRLSPQLAEAHFNIGVLLQTAGAYNEARAHYLAAVRERPDFADAHLNLGCILEEQAEVQAAIDAYQKALSADPQLVEAHANLGMQLLLAGDLEAGWGEYDWRLRYRGMSRVAGVADAIRWNGETLDGQTVLLEAEQGFGDAIQFVRYAPLVTARGARVVLRSPQELQALFSQVAGVSQAVTFDDALPRFDFYCPLPSLPLAFGTRLDTIPAQVPYLHVPEPARSRWRARMAAEAEHLKVGLVWASQSAHKTAPAKSLALSALEPLAAAEGVVFYSLQKGPAADQAASPPGGMRLVRWDRELADFADTAAAITQLDLVISVDTAVAHLAGALGCPAWVLLKHPPDWRWLLGRDSSPWYPTLKLFRQPQPGDWQAVVQAVARALRERTRAGALK